MKNLKFNLYKSYLCHSSVQLLHHIWKKCDKMSKQLHTQTGPIFQKIRSFCQGEKNENIPLPLPLDSEILTK